MAMEKNGAISSETPNCGSGCGCAKAASDALDRPIAEQLKFPNTAKIADFLENDLNKQAAEIVKTASKSAR